MAPQTTFRAVETPSIPKLKKIISHWDELYCADFINVENDYDPLTKLTEYLSNAKDGKVRVSYAHSAKAKISGRQYVRGGCGLQSFSRKIRHTIAGDTYRDYDIVNAHPVLLDQYCAKNGIQHDILSHYVQNREAIIEELGLPRDEGKQLFLSLLNGGVKEYEALPAKSEWIRQFKDQIKQIHCAISNMNPELLKAIKPEKKSGSILGSVMNHILCDIENQVLCKFVEFLKLRRVSTTNIVLVFDGFMLPRCLDVDLEAMMAYAEQTTGYAIRIVEKPMNEGIDLSAYGEPTQMLGADVELTDLSAFQLVYEAHKAHLKRKGTKILAWDESTGLWTENAYGIYVNWCVAIHPNNEYGTSARKIQASFTFTVGLPDDREFFAAAKERTKGKLLFKDGIWDKLEERRLDFTPDLCFVYAVPFPIPTAKPENVESVDRFLFTQPYPEEGVADWSRQDLMRAIFGLGSDTITFETGSGSNGKSRRIAACMKAFGDYVGTMAGNHITVEKNPSQGGASPHLMPLRDKRLIYVSEPKRGMLIDMEIVKKITGGDPITGRDLFQGVESFTSLAKLHFAANSIPKFSECEVSFMERRFRQLDSNVRYLDVEHGDPENLVYKRDEAFVQTMIHSCDALIWIMIHEPLRTLPVPESIKLASMETIEEQDDLKRLFFATFEKSTDNHKVFSKTILEVLGVQPKFLAGRMLEWGFPKPKVVRIGADQASGYSGLRRREQTV